MWAIPSVTRRRPIAQSPSSFQNWRRVTGRSVNYAEGKHQHVQVEFAFDIDQIAHHRMAPLGYSRHIGIRVPVQQLALAFYETYGLTEDFDVRKGRKFNVKAYRFATRTLIPRVAYAVTLLHRKQEPPEPDTPDALEIEKEAAAAAKLYNWAAYRKKAGVETHLLAGVLFVMPKFGPLAMVAVKGPTAAAEADYMHSVVSSTSVLRDRLALFTPLEARRALPCQRHEFHGDAGTARSAASSAQSRSGHRPNGQARRIFSD